jgi:hypothetical protein
MLIKLRFRFPEVFLGVLLTVAIFALGAMFSLSPDTRAPVQPRTETKTGNTSNENKKEVAWWQDPIAIFTLGLVFIGAVQAVIFYGQMTLISKSLKPAEEAARAAKEAAEALPKVERAYVFIIPELEFWDPRPHSSGVGQYSSRIGVKFKIVNHGKTPAVVESIDARLRVLPEAPDNRIHVNANIEPGETILEAGQRGDPLLSPRNCNVSEAEADAIERNQSAIWFYGSVYYWDIFGKDHWTRFRWSYSAVLEVFTPRGEAPYNERT